MISLQQATGFIGSGDFRADTFFQGYEKTTGLGSVLTLALLRAAVGTWATTFQELVAGQLKGSWTQGQY